MLFFRLWAWIGQAWLGLADAGLKLGLAGLSLGQAREGCLEPSLAGLDLGQAREGWGLVWLGKDVGRLGRAGLSLGQGLRKAREAQDLAGLGWAMIMIKL
ncbi:hypothetical protein BY996DRAFT_6479126 [Phakopsora pachyrhizi]|nr:hypothetical protein BY996DRAFT_6479126 [Phakopsora pachyrhizi]